ncbi:pet56p [Saccharomyces arboricola H-6]|uniref:rRNA methyltransferase 1, mitochondrial n=1 Tax=Saccharomyces arboricola (strain H-6 / AS 2.3317 / CBS 10644) TaxID=1160507 RepID=J8PYZ5_SACAR|nr:pet56p [Saccharomyces arboricola H-6]
MTFLTNAVFKRYLAVGPSAQQAFKTRAKKKPSSFDKFFPQQGNARKKQWEVLNEDKESWFKRKYAHVHARERGQASDPYGKKEAHVDKLREIKNQAKLGQKKHKSKFQNSSMVQKLMNDNPILEYVYGTNSVYAALLNPARTSHSRVLYHGTIPGKIMQKVDELGITTEPADKHRLNLLTNYGVHNNIVLETKPLQPMEIAYLGDVDAASAALTVHELGFSNENIMHEIPYSTKADCKRFPLGLYLDEITDPHNIGAIIRSAYFLGADFVVMSRKNCSPLTAVASKTSSGALELLPIFYVDKPLEFFTKSQEMGGWTFITSHLADATAEKYTTGKTLGVRDLCGMCTELPIVLVVGNESQGVRTNLKMRSDFFVEIPFAGSETNVRAPEPLVDSLNVSVATALLIDNILSCK